MTSDDFMQELKKRGYNVKYDDVVTVLLEPDTGDSERLKTLIRDEIGWKNSFGIKYTGHPKWWDDPGDDRNLSDCSLIQNSRQEKRRFRRDRHQKLRTAKQPFKARCRENGEEESAGKYRICWR